MTTPAIETLDTFIKARNELGSRSTPAQTIVQTGTLIMESLTDDQNDNLRMLCLTLAVAVERLTAIEQLGIPTHI